MERPAPDEGHYPQRLWGHCRDAEGPRAPISHPLHDPAGGCLRWSFPFCETLLNSLQGEE